MRSRDLNGAAFDSRSIVLLRKILSGSSPKKLVAVTDFDNKMIDNKKNLIQLNELLNKRLVETLEKCSRFVSIQDAIPFLFAAANKKELDEATSLLEEAVSEERVLDSKMLSKLLKESSEMPMSMALALYGEDVSSELDAEAIQRNKKRGPTLDLGGLRL